MQPDIGSVADLRGKTVIVDAPNTAYALQLYDDAGARSGLKKGDYEVKVVGATFRRAEAIREDKTIAASMLNPPFSVRAEKAGLKSLGSAVKTIGPYQATGGFVMRAWAKRTRIRWSSTCRPTWKVCAGRSIRRTRTRRSASSTERLKLAEDVAAQAYAIATDPAEGFDKDAQIDLEGFRNVLKLRATHLGTWGGTPPDPEKYLDLSYYQKALAGM